jgi:uncharacterized protein (DUF486 family)
MNEFGIEPRSSISVKSGIFAIMVTLGLVPDVVSLAVKINERGFQYADTAVLVVAGAYVVSLAFFAAFSLLFVSRKTIAYAVLRAGAGLVTAVTFIGAILYFREFLLLGMLRSLGLAVLCVLAIICLGKEYPEYE